MMKVEAIIRPERLGPVKHALEEIAIHAMTVSEVQGRGEQKGLEFTHRAGKYRVDLLPKVKVEVVLQDEKVDAVVAAVCAAARTGEVGDGKIFVLPVERMVRVRTGEVSR